ncbi:multidrug effflux MFS transporter [Litorivicinus lipolyticus]|uniref:multidrug effflux MFS transporter n=1 Tax=Litorivicinus lipolyticus TaxID=418701 RepID=UPI003B5A6B3A
MLTPTTPVGRGEFIAMQAFMIALVAMSIDAVLPALGVISDDFALTDPNQRQWVIGTLFLGMTAGQYFYGPLTDRFGRRHVFFAGLALFLVGGAMAAMADSFESLMAGRLIQGIGVAGPRIVSQAMIRDRFSGVEMAKVSSLIMTVFIAVPVFAPSIGQVVLWFTDWRGIFWGLLVAGLTVGVWVGLRQPESLPAPRSLRLFSILSATWEVLSNRVALCCTVAVGCTFGTLVGFLMSSQQIYQETFGVGDAFALYFGLGALSVGVASFANSIWVERFGMRRTCLTALAFCTVWSALFAGLDHISGLSLWQFMVFVMPLFFCLGLCFGNLTAMAMEPMGHIAGTASAVIGTLSSLISVLGGGYIGGLYDGSLVGVLSGFSLGLLVALLFTLVSGVTAGQAMQKAIE